MLQPVQNETDESSSVTAESRDVAAEADIDDEAKPQASAVENSVDTSQAAVASHSQDTDCQLLWSDNIADTDQPARTESVSVMAGCEAQNGGQCIRPLDSVHTVADDVVKCSTVSDDDETSAAASPSTDAELADNSLLSADSGSVQVPVSETAGDVAADNVDVHDEPLAAVAAAAVANEPQQPAADAEVAEVVGNIIPAPLAVLAPQGLGDVHQALMQGGGPVGFQPYKHPNLFALRVNVAAVELLNVVVIIIDECS